MSAQVKIEAFWAGNDIVHDGAWWNIASASVRIRFIGTEQTSVMTFLTYDERNWRFVIGTQRQTRFAQTTHFFAYRLQLKSTSLIQNVNARRSQRDLPDEIVLRRHHHDIQ